MGSVQLQRLEPVMPPRLRRYLSLRRAERQMLEGREYGLRKPEQTVPPEGERITFHCVWAMEAYTPLHAGQLFDRLEGLGFGREGVFRRSDLRTQLERARRGPRGGTYLSLEHVFPPGQSGGFMHERVETPLPSGIKVARPTLHALTPSVTMMVVQFVLDDDAATAFDRLSRETGFKPRTRIHENGISMTPSDQVKQEALRALRAEMRSGATSWVAENVPGAFASNLGGHPMPSAELVTTELAVPFARSDDVRDYLEFAGFGYDPFHWISDEIEHWRLTFDRDEEFAIIAGRRSEVVKDDYTQHGRDERWPMTYELQEYLGKDLALWGSSHLLLAFHARLRAIRDHELRPRRFKSASRRLKTIRDEFLRDALDARDAAVELERYADDERRFEWNACEWKSNDDRVREDELLANLREAVRDHAAGLIGAEARLRDGLMVDSSVVGTRAGLQINLVALLIAIASLLIAARALTDNNSPAPAQTPTTVQTVPSNTPTTPQRTPPRVEPARPTKP